MSNYAESINGAGIPAEVIFAALLTPVLASVFGLALVAIVLN